MRKSRFTEDQVIKVLKEHAAGMSADELCRKYQKSRRAKSALQAMVIDESLLQRMQLVAGRQALDRAYLFSLRLDGKHQAGADHLAINDHSAGTADAVLAADMRSGLPAFVADGIDQSAARLQANDVIAPVDSELDVDFFVHRVWPHS
jgi:hypothetical protein